jgi:asparagine synthase (glutamine-hydrolysing)
LYYVIAGKQLLFASEIKALLKHPRCPRNMNVEALAELFTFRYVPSPKTLFDKIMKLPPAHFMVVSAAGVHIERFWNSIPRPQRIHTEADYIEQYQGMVEDAVRLQMRSDVPVGLFLSSGVDSGALLAIMSKYASGPVQAFTIGFEGGEKTNEVNDAKSMARMFGADHHFEMLSPADYMKYYERYMMDLEEPVGNETAAAFYFVARLARRNVKVALTGQGADEPWAGYDRYKGIKLSALYSQFPHAITNPLAYIISRMPGRFERLKRGVGSLAEPDMLTRLAKIYSFFSAEMKSQLYKGALKTNFERDPYSTRAALARLQTDVRHLDPLTQMLYIDTRANLPDDLLMVSDKTSMANSLESRVPFLDYRLIEFIENLPSKLKLNGLNGKYLHKKAMNKWLPKEVVYRKKKGFANPIEDWFRVGMRPYVEECLLSADSSMAQYFDQKYIQRILQLDRDGRQQYRRHIYLLVSLELWHRAFMRN